GRACGVAEPPPQAAAHAVRDDLAGGAGASAVRWSHWWRWAPPQVERRAVASEGRGDRGRRAGARSPAPLPGVQELAADVGALADHHEPGPGEGPAVDEGPQVGWPGNPTRDLHGRRLVPDGGDLVLARPSG